jgi:hypothetical protein
METAHQSEVGLAQQLVSSLTAGQKAFAAPSSAGDAAAWRNSLDALLVQWAQDGHDLAVRNAYANLGLQDANDPVIDKGKTYHRYDLTRAYLTANKPIVGMQLEAAGVRLARVLNEALR